MTPFGPAVWGYALGIATNGEITRLITEWQRTSPLSVTWALFYASVAGAVALVWLARRRDGLLPSGPTLAWLAGLAVLGAYAERGVAWWAFGAPVALAQTRAALLAPRRAPCTEPRALRRLNAVLVVALALVLVVAQPLWRDGDPLTGPTGLLVTRPGVSPWPCVASPAPRTAWLPLSRGRPGSNGRRPESPSWSTRASR